MRWVIFDPPTGTQDPNEAMRFDLHTPDDFSNPADPTQGHEMVIEEQAAYAAEK